MKTDVALPLKKVKKLIEKVSGYKITVSKPKLKSPGKPKSKAAIKKKMDEVGLDYTSIFSEADLQSEDKRLVIQNIIKKHSTNKAFKRTVDYIGYYEKLPVDDSVILYESFHGKNISCNPYAIFKNLVKNPDFSEYRHVWALNNREDCPEWIAYLPNVELVTVHSDEYLRYLVSAKYLINNTSFPPYFIKKDEQVYVNTWHGTPLKTLGKDMNGTLGQHKNLMKNFLQSDFIVSPNRFTADKIVDSHDLRGIYSGKIAETGYPRIDAVTENHDHLKALLGCDSAKGVLLYAPTWRGEVGKVSAEIDRFVADAQQLEKTVGDRYTVLLKVHSLMKKHIKEKNLKLNVVSDAIDTNELLSITDVLLTDYSSIFFDFMVTQKPIIFYAYDRLEYEVDRGFYLNLDDMPGAICTDIGQVTEEINRAHTYQEDHAMEIQQARKNFISLEDGASTQRLIDAVFNQHEQHTYSVLDDKTNILIYSGGFMNNGVTSSVINLMNNIDYAKYNVMIADKSNFDEESSRNHVKLNKNVKKYYRAGNINYNLDELLEQELLFKHGAETFYHNGPENFLDDKILAIYRREYKRMFGHSKIDVVIDFSGYVKFWTLLFAANNFDKKLIFQHNEMMEEYVKVIAGKYKHQQNLNVIFPLYNYFDSIVSVAKHTRNTNQQRLSHLVANSEEKMIYVHNSINYEYVLDAIHERGADDSALPELMNRDIEPVHAMRQPDAERFSFVTMGRMSPEKDHQKLISAFALLHQKRDDVELFIIGTGQLKDELIQQIADCGLEDHIHLVGQLENPFPLIQACDSFVLPSNHEGQPMVLLECLILNKPILATDIPGNRSILEDGYGEIVENSINGLFLGMEKLLTEQPAFKVFDYKTYNEEAMEMFYQSMGKELAVAY
ncbi:glycosyltransferase [Microbacterium sp. APC 3898]|uniref:Glycosyltransferase n=1 Tax=Planococcus notacanthi TaxID=3035188 RepID=A0ABT7ZEX2_9BACL|nr:MULTISPECIES: glycosyltransferase [Terrabacteria group]MDN3425707.1 glycosyltransferase [Planococcus sp. APC 4016]MDN3500745.1 glycosyltransferase [Microbacterium sp. APC 3898]